MFSGVPQGTVLGPTLFLIFFKDIDDSLTNTVFKFADDSKLVGQSRNLDDRAKLQRNLDLMKAWEERWCMKFIVDKCKHLQISDRKRNVDGRYTLGLAEIENVDSELDLGVTVNCYGKRVDQCLKAAKKANAVLGMIKRTIQCRDREVLIPLYKSLVRPHLEYCGPAWRPHYKKDINTIEKVQRRFTRMVPGLQELSYEERLKKLKLTSMYERFLRNDLILVYKILFRHMDVNPATFFKLSHNTHLREHILKL